MDISTLALLLLIPLLVWRVSSYLRRMMGRNPSQLWVHYSVPVGLLVLLGMQLFQLRASLLGMATLLVGTSAGAFLGWYNLKLSRLEQTKAGFFYTQNKRLGMVVCMLLVARFVYRLFELYLQMHMGTPVSPDFQADPLTTLPLGLIIGFYTAFHLLLAQWRRQAKPLPSEHDLPPLD